jgi:hypothetical protein
MLVCCSSGDSALLDGSSQSDATLGDAGTASDGDHPPIFSRLFVSHMGGVAIWDHAEQLAADVAPNVQLTNEALSGAHALALANNRLLVAGEDPAAALVAFDGADTLSAGATAVAKIPRLPPLDGGGSTVPFGRLVVDAGDRLWARLGAGPHYGDGVALFNGASTLGSTSTAQAVFTHPWHQLAGYAFDPVGGRLFVSQLSGAGLLVWNDAAQATGARSHDFVLSGAVNNWMTIEGTRLHGVGVDNNGMSNGIRIWQPVSTLSAPTEPAITNRKLIGPAYVSYLALRDDTLAVAIENYGVYIYLGASALTADTPPSVQIIDPALSEPVVVTKLALTADGRLYVLLPDRVLVFRDVTTAPVLAATLKSSLSKPTDLMVLE